MAGRGYKKYMKKNVQKDYNLVKIFVISFCAMLLIFTYLIKSFTPSVDVSIGDYKQETEIEDVEEIKKNVDNRLAMIQDEDRGRNFEDIMRNADDVDKNELRKNIKPLSKATIDDQEKDQSVSKDDSNSKDIVKTQNAEPVYKVFIGTYTSAEQAKVAKDIISDTGSSLNPIVKCIGSNNYTLQVGIFKNKASADALLYTIQQNHLPGRIVQDY